MTYRRSDLDFSWWLGGEGAMCHMCEAFLAEHRLWLVEHGWQDEEADVNDVRQAGVSPSDILDRCKQIAQSKSHDYTTQGVLDGPGRFENFDRAAIVASWFPDPQDKPFAVLIGVKLARLAALLSKDSAPKNESIDDTFVDLTNYCALWGSRRSQR